MPLVYHGWVRVGMTGRWTQPEGVNAPTPDECWKKLIEWDATARATARAYRRRYYGQSLVVLLAGTPPVVGPVVK